jgi:hypothetical protein
MQLRRYGFIADIISSPSFNGHIFHYVIQPESSVEIVHWGQEVSMQRALECVEEFLSQYANQQKAATEQA